MTTVCIQQRLGAIALLTLVLLGAILSGPRANAASRDDGPVKPKVISGATPLAPTCTLPNELGGRREQEMDPQIAVNPTNQKNMAAAWTQDWADATVVAVTFDGGVTWDKVVPPGSTHCNGAPYDSSQDPDVAFGPDGTLYVTTWLSHSQPPFHSAMIVNVSKDGGKAWQDAVYLDRAAPPTGFDWSWVAPDPTTPGTAYVGWLRFSFDVTTSPPTVESQMMLSKTTDRGMTWSPARSIGKAPSGKLWGPVRLFVLPDGALVNLFNESEPAEYPFATGYRVLASRSVDGGETWRAPTEVAVAPSQHTDPDINKIGHPFAGGLAAGPNGELYYVWSNIAPDRSSEVLITASRDRGDTWTTPHRVLRSPVPVMNLNLSVGSDGTLGLIFYDFRNDHDGDEQMTADAWFLRSTNGGRAWKETHLAGPFDANAISGDHNSLGQNQGIAPIEDGFVAAFTMAKPLAEVGAMDIFFAHLGS